MASRLLPPTPPAPPAPTRQQEDVFLARKLLSRRDISPEQALKLAVEFHDLAEQHCKQAKELKNE